MINFPIPVKLNGAELKKELADAGIEIDVPIVENGLLWLEINANQKNLAAEVISNHSGTIIAPEPNFEEKLASVGLNLADLKNALGL